MKFKSQLGQDVKLKMWEKTLMPESIMEKLDGKTVFKKTGQKIEMTTYTFVDGFGEKLVFLSSENGYRNLEGETVDIVMEVEYNDFSKKNRLKLESVAKSESKKA